MKEIFGSKVFHLVEKVALLMLRLQTSIHIIYSEFLTGCAGMVVGSDNDQIKQVSGMFKRVK